MNPLIRTLAANLIASNQTVAELLELNEGLEDEIGRLEEKKPDPNTEAADLRLLLAHCPLLTTTTQNAAELSWIKAAKRVLSEAYPQYHERPEFSGHPNNLRRG